MGSAERRGEVRGRGGRVKTRVKSKGLCPVGGGEREREKGLRMGSVGTNVEALELENMSLKSQLDKYQTIFALQGETVGKQDASSGTPTKSRKVARGVYLLSRNPSKTSRTS